MTAPITTILATGPDGPTLVHTYDVDMKASWITPVAYSQRDGGGSFLSFLQRDKFGDWYEIIINGGICQTKIKGKANMSVDIVGPIDGVQANMSVVGKFDDQPAMGPGTWPALFSLGGPSNPYLQVWLQEFPRRPTMPAGVTRCVKINGGYVPIYD